MTQRLKSVIVTRLCGFDPHSIIIYYYYLLYFIASLWDHSNNPALNSAAQHAMHRKIRKNIYIEFWSLRVHFNTMGKFEPIFYTCLAKRETFTSLKALFFLLFPRKLVINMLIWMWHPLCYISLMCFEQSIFFV